MVNYLLIAPRMFPMMYVRGSLSCNFKYSTLLHDHPNNGGAEHLFISSHFFIAEEYCTSERFNARCSSFEILLVRRALYGRLAAGRCITAEYAHAIGCFSDVTSYVDEVCSGRTNCSLLVASLDSIAQPCAKDFKSYLEVTHECVRGWTDV